MKPILKKDGSVSYYINRVGDITNVLDNGCNLLGYIKNGQTFDSSGQLVSLSEDISCLVVR